MTEVEKPTQAQDFIAREVQKKGADRIDALYWEQGPHDPAAGIHRLIAIRGGEKSIFTFTEYEFLENYGSKQWERELRGHISDVLMEL